jgi:predicted NAD-dependent protein-ADP-ribosyltransferase YbiA (DUF1768 family)
MHAIYDLKGKRYLTVMHYFFSQCFSDNPEWVKEIDAVEDAALVERKGTKALLRAAVEWNKNLTALMLRGIFFKTALHRDVYDALMKEAIPIQVEGNCFWGMGSGEYRCNVFGKLLKLARNACLANAIPTPSDFVEENKEHLSMAFAAWVYYKMFI